MNYLQWKNDLQQRFNEAYTEASKKAINKFIKFKYTVENIEDSYEKFETISQEYQSCEKYADHNAILLYYDLFNLPDALFSIFINRCLFFEENDFSTLKDNVFKAQYCDLLNNLIREMQSQAPGFSFEDYQKGIKKLRRFSGFYVDLKEIDCINHFVFDACFKIIEHYLFFAKKAFVELRLSNEQQSDFYDTEINKIEAILMDDNRSIEDIYESIQHVYFFKVYPTPKFNFDALRNHLTIYHNHDLDFNVLTYKEIRYALSQIDKAATTPYFSEILFFNFLKKLLSWLQQQKQAHIEQPDLMDDAPFDSIQIAKQINREIELAYLQQKQIIISELNQLDEKQKIGFLKNKLDVLLHRLTKQTDEVLLSLGNQALQDGLLPILLLEAYLSDCLQEEIENIKSFAVHYQMLCFIDQEIVNQSDFFAIEYAKNVNEIQEIIGILPKMIIVDPLFKKVKSILDSFDTYYNFYHFPLLSATVVTRNNLFLGFKEAITILEAHFADGRFRNANFYLTKTIHECEKQLFDLKIQAQDIAELTNQSTTFLSLFKQFLYIQEKHIQQLAAFKKPPILINKRSTIETPEITFDEIFPGKKGEYVLDLIERLKITRNGKVDLHKKENGPIRGLAEALIKREIPPKIGLMKLYLIIAQKLNHPIKSNKIDATPTSSAFFKKALSLIDEAPWNKVS